MFDEVNEDIQPFKPKFMAVDLIEEIDTHCLDNEEAIAITKQKIFDLAEQLSQNHKQ